MTGLPNLFDHSIEKGAELAAKSAELRGKVATIGAIEQAREDLKIVSV